MEQPLQSFVWDIAKTIGLAIVFLIPVCVVIWRLAVSKKERRQKAIEPFTGQPLRPPGESLRLKIQELEENLSDELLILVGFPAVLTGVSVMSAKSVSWTNASVLFLFIGLFAWWRGRRVKTAMHTLWNYQLGFEGERVVGEELNQLMLEGYRVFHDFPGEDFNIDHIIVGSTGVYAVETKSRRKRQNDKGKKLEWRVTYDGSSLSFMSLPPQTNWVEQAERNARYLSTWLTKAVGEKVTAEPILILPGWLVDRSGRGSVKVLNEKEVWRSFTQPDVPLSPQLLQRIAHQLSERCRLPSS